MKDSERAPYEKPSVSYWTAGQLDSIEARMSGGGGGGGDYYCPGGALWKFSAPPTPVLPHGTYATSVWYVPVDKVSVLVDLVSDDQYLALMTQYMSGTLKLAGFAAALYTGGVAVAAEESLGVIAKGLSVLAAFLGMSFLDLTQAAVGRVRSAAGYSGAATYRNGVRYETQVQYDDEQQIHRVTAWDGGPYLSAPVNQRGTWTPNSGLL